VIGGGVVLNSFDREMLKLAIKAMIVMLRSYASALNNVADVEERSGRRFDEVIRDMFSPATLSTLYEMLPSDVYGELMGTFFKIASQLTTVQDPTALSVDQKRKVSSEMIKLASLLEKVVEKL
jgi:hypothetical protein